MSGFHHPAPSFEARFFFDGSGFFATSADMRSETELSNNAADLIEVVSLVEAETVGRAAVGKGRAAMIPSSVLLTNFMS